MKRLIPWLLFRGLSAAALLLAAVPALAQTVVRTSVNPLIYTNLPIIIAVEKGYFKAEGLDVQVTQYKGSSVGQTPLLARGDLDITMMVAGPSLFNQRSEGFDIKLIASISEPHQGWMDSSWLLVRKDLAGSIKTLKDIKGHAIDGATLGSANDLLAAQAVQMAGLTRSDVTYTNRIRAADGLAALQNKAVDVLSSVEPTVGELVDQGLAVRLASSVDVMPWFQESYLAGSSDWLSKHQQAVASFLKAYLHAAKDITDNGPKWNPEHAQILSKWSKVPVESITRLPGPGYVGQYGAIRAEALSRQQVFWASEGLVKTQVEPASLFDSSYLDQARKAMNLN